MKPFIKQLKDVGIKDVSEVGGKNASLGEMIQNLTPKGIKIPGGFIVTASAYKYFLNKTQIANRESKNLSLKKFIKEILKELNTKNLKDVAKRGKIIRETIKKSEFSSDLRQEIVTAYRNMEDEYGKNTDVAVRSSATAEDLPGASFAGEHETYLNIRGDKEALRAVKSAMASLFTDRAISYRVDKGFNHFKVALSVGIQKMVRSDLGCSGVMFTLDTESGFKDVVLINGSWGLGEMIVQGKVTPDEFLVFKPILRTLDVKKLTPIIDKKLGVKNRKMVYSDGRGINIKNTKIKNASQKEKESFILSDEEILQLAKWGVLVEEHYSNKNGKWTPMDLEWAKDGRTGELFIVQARPETIHARRDFSKIKEYVLSYVKGQMSKILVKGSSVGSKIATGRARMILDAKNINKFKAGEILVTDMTDPDWEPIMKMSSAIVTDKGGRTSHAAIVSRELGIPCIVGTQNATKVLRDGDEITADCSSGENGLVYRGKLSFDVLKHSFEEIPKTKTDIMVNIGNPQEAFKFHYLPARGVGLGRIEFIIASQIKIHPNALINFDHLKKSKDKEHEKVVKNIQNLTSQYSDKKLFYIDKLAEGMGRIAAAFYPYEVLIRFSDFKTNQYRSLIGGDLYEPIESNPMLGLRGASRYYNPLFKEAFGLECKSILKAREEFGLKNIMPIVPFCRTAEEGKRVIEAMKEFGLSRKTSPGIKIYVMCEIPSNVLRADEFLDIFDGFSIGSNDLAQLTLGLDRDSDVI